MSKMQQLASRFLPIYGVDIAYEMEGSCASRFSPIRNEPPHFFLSETGRTEYQNMSVTIVPKVTGEGLKAFDVRTATNSQISGEDIILYT